jgi:hypothetical protein
MYEHMFIYIHKYKRAYDTYVHRTQRCAGRADCGTKSDREILGPLSTERGSNKHETVSLTNVMNLRLHQSQSFLKNASSGKLLCVALARTDVSEERIAFIIRVKRTSEQLSCLILLKMFLAC